MELRSDLTFPTLDEPCVQRIAKLASRLDGSGPGESDDELREFNERTGTSYELSEFQGIFGGMEHETWVRTLLCEPFATKPLAPTRDELLEIITRLTAGDDEVHEQFFWIRVLETHLDPEISDLIYWPGEYFGDGDNSRELSPQQILETAFESKP